jgi:CO/xanthine dehydrogenase FAD-binding subunit
VNNLEYFTPQSVEEALELLAEHSPAIMVMAGGTIAMPLINEGISFPEKVLGLKQAGLNYVGSDNGTVKIGSAATLSQVQSDCGIPILEQAARSIGGWAIQNMGTAGGNLFAPPPAGDLAAALLVLDAELVLRSAKGERSLPLESFYTGFLATTLEPEELVAEIRVPKPAGKTAFNKTARKGANTPAVVTAAFHLVFEGGKVDSARVALNAVGPYPMRMHQCEAVLEGSALNAETISKVAETAAKECQPFTDAIASDWYRRRMVDVTVRRTLAGIKG